MSLTLARRPGGPGGGGMRRRTAVSAIAVAAFAVLLGGCATTATVRTDVTTFHQWENAEPLTFSFRRAAGEQQSLEHLDYERQVAERLQALGFRPAADGAARYQVGIGYSTNTQLQRHAEYPFHPYYPPFGGLWGWPRPVYGAGFMYHDPWLWGAPMMPLARDVPVAVHTLRVDLFDMQGGIGQGRKVWESRADVASGRGLPAAMPALVASVFAEFPGPSGRTRPVRVELPPQQ
jgi:hypothetical protein